VANKIAIAATAASIAAFEPKRCVPIRRVHAISQAKSLASWAGYDGLGL
jgi:hypothetical protein